MTDFGVKLTESAYSPLQNWADSAIESGNNVGWRGRNQYIWRGHFTAAEAHLK